MQEGTNLKDPVTGEFLTFANLKERLGSSSIGTGEVIRNIFDSGNTRPGYSTGFSRVSTIQSRRVFRYQPAE